MPPDRMICCLAASDLAGVPAGVSPAHDPITELEGKEIFRPRTDELERDATLRQLATYAVLVGGPPVLMAVWVYARGDGGDEPRLRQWSIGVGGHVTLKDATHAATLRSTLIAATSRELREEIDLGISDAWYKDDFLIRDDTDDVGRVHLGYMPLIRVPQSAMRPIKSRDPQGVIPVGWIALDELATLRDRLESWSRLALDILLDDTAVSW